MTHLSTLERPELVVVDLDGTLMHDAPTFEERFVSDYSIWVLQRLHDSGIRCAVSTARPVSTGLSFVQKLPTDACSYLNGALIDFQPLQSDFDSLTNPVNASQQHVVKVGFPSRRACEVCLQLLSEIPDLRIGIVMDDMRYTNFDVREYWTTQSFTITDFHDVPEGVADKIIIFPKAGQSALLEQLVPEDLAVNISEGVMWMLMNPMANKEQSLMTICKRFGISPRKTVSFGDDTIDIAMLQRSGIGVAIANAHTDVLHIADEVCPSNNLDGVAHWIEEHLL